MLERGEDGGDGDATRHRVFVRHGVPGDFDDAKVRGEGEDSEVQAVGQQVMGKVEVGEQWRQARHGPQCVVLSSEWVRERGGREREERGEREGRERIEREGRERDEGDVP